MKLKHLLILVIALGFASITTAQKKSEITTAEGMVVFNKKNNKPQYNGLIVIYNYEIVNSNPVKSQDLLQMVESKFIKVIKAEKKMMGTKEILTITTEGKMDNNPIYYEILEANSKFLVQNKRELLLK